MKEIKHKNKKQIPKNTISNIQAKQKSNPLQQESIQIKTKIQRLRKQRKKKNKNFRTWLNLVWRDELTSSKARRRDENSLRASSETKSLAMPSQSMFLDALKATSVTFLTVPLIFPPDFAEERKSMGTARGEFVESSKHRYQRLFFYSLSESLRTGSESWAAALGLGLSAHHQNFLGLS